MSLDMDSYVDDVLKDFNIDLGDFDDLFISSGNNESNSNDKNETNKKIEDMLNKVMLGKMLSI